MKALTHNRLLEYRQGNFKQTEPYRESNIPICLIIHVIMRTLELSGWKRKLEKCRETKLEKANIDCRYQKKGGEKL